jgi:hypothetical protein
MADETTAPKPEEFRFRGIGFELGPPPAGASKIDESETNKDSQDAKRGAASQLNSFDRLGHQFATRLQLLWTYVRQIGGAAQSTSFANMAGILALVNDIAETAKEKKEEEPIATFRLVLDLETNDDKREKRTLSFAAPLYEERHERAILERRKYHHAALRILHETAVQQLVNAYEQLLAELLREHIAANTSDAAKDRSITYQQLLEFGSLEEAQRHVIEVQVTEFVRGHDTAQQFKYFRDNLKVDVSANFPDLSHYRELVLRRHAIVHAGGTATADYVRKLKSIGGFPPPVEGSQLELSAQYVTNAWEVVYALGVVTLHLVAKLLARRERDEEAEDRVDNWLNTAGLWAISERRYSAAERIFTYANPQRLAKDSCQLMVLVNLAQTHKWRGNDGKCVDLLKSRDWDATNSAFRLCVAVLRDEPLDVVEALMRQAVKEDQVSLDSVYEWPVFQRLRKQPGFTDLMKNVFGSAADRQVEPFPPRLLDLSADARLDKIFKQLEEMAKAGGTQLKLEASKPKATNSGTPDTTVH